MTAFLRLLADKDKARNLLGCCSAVRGGEVDTRVFQVSPESFRSVPGAPFAYWIGPSIREAFENFPTFEGNGRTVKIGMKTGDDFRFLRLW